ncbi:hypothetical protein HZ326_28905 [Fusarium oxysporum f. sp. albedinis]|nr:hypothetical protein HZ326_28905 [Fusarium oxysporum f. sp. albedinis]
MFNSPWSPPSKDAVLEANWRSSENVDELGLRSITPLLKQSENPRSGAAANSTDDGRSNRCSRLDKTSVSASRKRIRSNCVCDHSCSFVKVSCRSGRPIAFKLLDAILSLNHLRYNEESSKCTYRSRIHRWSIAVVIVRVTALRYSMVTYCKIAAITRHIGVPRVCTTQFNPLNGSVAVS